MSGSRGFLGLDPLPPETVPAATVVPVPWERSTSYLRGTSRGPAALLRASLEVELWDEVLEAEPWRATIDTAPPVDGVGDDAEDSLVLIEETVERILDDGGLPLLLGGEHTLSLGAVRALARAQPGLSVLQVDAHADLREAYRGDRFSHASVMARIREICPHVGVGIRALSAAEARTIDDGALAVWMAHRCRGFDWIDDVIDALGDPVYVTLDLDGLDPSVVPAVGTPVPGGLDWHQVDELLRRCARRRRIVGVDVVELCPRDGDEASAFTAAKLAYRALGYALTRGGSEPVPERSGSMSGQVDGGDSAGEGTA